MDENYNSPYSPDSEDNKDSKEDVYGRINQNSTPGPSQNNPHNPGQGNNNGQRPLYEQPDQRDSGQGTYNSPYDYNNYNNNQQNQNQYYDNRQYQNQQYNNQPYNNQPQYNQGPHYYHGPEKKTNGMAIAGMVLGIISIVLFCLCSYLGMILGIVGIVLSLLSREPDKPLSTQAKIGLVTGIIGLVMALIFVVIWEFMGMRTYFADEFMRELNNYNYDF